MVGTTTDADGAFRLPAAPGQRLTVSYLGYKSKTVTVGSRTSLDIILESDNSLINEVVVVGYDTQKKVNLTGSVASVSAEDLANRPIVSSSTALQGIAPGVTVTTQSGAPGGDGGMIRVRGIGTFGGSSAAPLVLIDGVEGSLDAVDATQIDQISVLKDAASSAIYGSRAANGVILVTTKRGKKGQTSVTYRGYVGWQSPTDTPETVSAEEYMILSRETSFNDGKESIYTDDYIARYRENNRIDPDNYPLTDWQDQILTGSGFTHNHNLSLTASTERVRVMTSFGYLDQKGIIKRTDYQRYNVRNNMNIDFSDKLSMRFDVSFVNGDRRRIPQQNTLFNYMNTRDPLILSRWSTGYWAGLSGGSTNVLPTLEGEGGNVKNNTIRLNGAVTLTFKPVKWLTLEGMVAPRYVTTNNHTFVKKMKFYSDAFGTVSNSSNVAFNYLDESANRSFYGNYQFTAALQHTFAQNHNFKLLLGASRETYDNKTLSAHREDFAYPDYEVIGAGADNETKDNGGGHAQWALQSFFGRLNYNFKERYLFEANVRFDGSSRFAKGNRWGIFPSFSGAWRLTEEPFMQDVRRTLSEFKIRASYGQLGNQNIGSNYPTIQQLDVSSISVNDVITPIVTQTTLANPDITWESTEMYDVGIDATLFDKLSVTADWYYKKTHDILLTLDIPSIIGLGAPYQNAGMVRNVGWEVAVGYHNKWRDFSFGVEANLSDVVNKIIDMKGTTGGSGAIRNQEGSAINSIYGLKCVGMARTQEEADWVNENCPQYGVTTKPGDLIYADMDDSGTIDDKDMTIIGSTVAALYLRRESQLRMERIESECLLPGCRQGRRLSELLLRAALPAGRNLPQGASRPLERDESQRQVSPSDDDRRQQLEAVVVLDAQRGLLPSEKYPAELYASQNMAEKAAHEVGDGLRQCAEPLHDHRFLSGLRSRGGLFGIGRRRGTGRRGLQLSAGESSYDGCRTEILKKQNHVKENNLSDRIGRPAAVGLLAGLRTAQRPLVGIVPRERGGGDGRALRRLQGVGEHDGQGDPLPHADQRLHQRHRHLPYGCGQSDQGDELDADGRQHDVREGIQDGLQNRRPRASGAGQSGQTAGRHPRR